MRHDIEITFEEAYLGAKKQITLNREDICDICHGSGAKPGSKVDTCTTCGRNRTNKADTVYIVWTNANFENMYNLYAEQVR